MSALSVIGNFFRTKLKGTTPAGFPTSGALGSNTQALHVGAFLGTPAQLAAANPIITQNLPWNALKVGVDPTGVFVEDFDVNLDTVNKWNSSTGAGGTLPAVSAGLGGVSSGTAISGYSRLASIPGFPLPPQSFMGLATILKVEAGVSANNYRFFGPGVGSTVPTVTAAVTNGIGFEITPAGLMQAVVWSAGVKTFTSLITKPTDGLFHRYLIFYRASKIFWFIDNTDNHVATCDTATAGYSPPQVSALGILKVSVNDPTLVPTVNSVPGAVTFEFQATTVADYAKNGTQLVDGKFNWRTANISANGGLSIRGVAIPNFTGTIAVGTTGIIGPIDISEAANISFIVKNTIAGSPYTGAPTLIFEQSDDSVSWAPMAVTSSATGTTQDTFILSANTANASILFDCAAEGNTFVRVRVTTPPTTNGMTIVVQPGALPFSPVVAIVTPRRTIASYYTAAPVAVTATEVLLSLTSVRNGNLVAATTTPAVITAGKILRITRISVTYIAIATTGHAIVRIRNNPTGPVAVGSLFITDVDVGANAPTTVNSTQTVEMNLSEPIELVGGSGLGITVQGYNGLTPAAAGFIKVTVFGHEQ
jgi:hypothetical protein